MAAVGIVGFSFETAYAATSWRLLGPEPAARDLVHPRPSGNESDVSRSTVRSHMILDKAVEMRRTDGSGALGKQGPSPAWRSRLQFTTCLARPRGQAETRMGHPEILVREDLVVAGSNRFEAELLPAGGRSVSFASSIPRIDL